MRLREIFSDDKYAGSLEDFNVSVFLEHKPEKLPLFKAITFSVTLHITTALVVVLAVNVLSYILLAFGINLDMFAKPKMKVRDIEFAFVLPEKYDVKKSFLNHKPGASYSLSGPEPNNRPYNGDKGSLKSEVKDKSVAKDKVVNKKPLKNTKQAASQTTVPLSKTPKKGSSFPPISEPDVFSAKIPLAEMNTDIGWGAEGDSGFHSPTEGNASFKGDGEGSGGSGEGDSVGDGKVKGGGYYYGSAGAPRPQTANSYRNENLDVDLRPYITELQRRVLRNWSMPSNDNSKKTVLFLRIAKNGNLMILNIKTPSGDTYIDELALKAVKNSLPFNPLPSGYRNQYADVILTFDYNVSAREN